MGVMFSLLLAVPVAAAMIINYAVDPMWCFNHETPFAVWRSEINFRQQKSNLLRFRNFQIDTVILGSSRIMNINPQKLDAEGFNFGVSGGMPCEYQTIMDIIYKTKGYYPRNIVVGLDFFGSRNDGNKHNVLQVISSFTSTPLAYRLQTMTNIKLATKSLMLLYMNHKSIAKSGDVQYSKGYMGAYSLYLPFTGKEVKKKKARAFCSDFMYRYKATKYDENYQKYLSALIESPLNANVKAFIPPESTPLLRLLIEIPGLLDDYERMLREVVSVFGGVWNFMYVNEITSNHEHWMESSHSLPHVNEWVIDRIYGRGNPPSDFGVYVTAENIDEHLREVRAQIMALPHQKDSWAELMEEE